MGKERKKRGRYEGICVAFSSLVQLAFKTWSGRVWRRERKKGKGEETRGDDNSGGKREETQDRGHDGQGEPGRIKGRKQENERERDRWSREDEKLVCKWRE